MLDRLRAHLARTPWLREGDRVLVGVSGGADSVCLLLLLYRLGYSVVAAHLHHGQRPEADQDEQRVRDLCDREGIEFVSARADVPALAADLGIGLEEAGREARYGFFEEARTATGADWIATAHTRNDQIETVVMNLIRGTGLRGLAGIPERRDAIIRPLLPFTRAETAEYCRAAGWTPVQDPSNEDPAFLRARVRKSVVPALREAREGADEAILRLAGLAGEEDRHLDSIAAAMLEQVEIESNGDLQFLVAPDEVEFDRNRLAGFPPVLVRRGLRLACSVLGASPDLDWVQTLCDRLGEGGKGSMSVEASAVIAEWDAGQLTIRRQVDEPPFRHVFEIPGQTIAGAMGWQLSARERLCSQLQPPRASLETEIPVACIRQNLYFRNFEQGDRMQPLGGPGERKVSDLLGEAKLSRLARKRLPLICDLVGPLWIPGVALAERCRPQKLAEPVVELKFESATLTTGHN